MTRVKEVGVLGFFFTRALDAPSPGSFFRRRRRVGADDGDPMTTPPPHGVLSADEEDREDDDVGASILRGNQCHCGIVSRGLLPAAMWSRMAGSVRPSMPHHTFLAAAFLLRGRGLLPLKCASSAR
jgi:hypothetical protein